jgi:hypothetical protein
MKRYTTLHKAQSSELTQARQRALLNVEIRGRVATTLDALQIVSKLWPVPNDIECCSLQC